MHLIIVAAAAAQTFNLMCAGTTTDETATPRTAVAYQHTYRIDLAKSVYCEDRCDTIKTVAAVQPTTIDLVDIDETAPGKQVRSVNSVNRETGEHSMHYGSRSRLLGFIYHSSKGQCERQPFTGFPKFETKF